MAIGGFSVLTSWGSKPSDIPDIDTVENPLPPCPYSPNCIRITKRIEAPLKDAFTIVREVIRQMNPAEIDILENRYKIDAIFRVFLFKDDMTVQITEGNSGLSFLHIRSASRTGFSDLGVNRRRVKKILKKVRK